MPETSAPGKSDRLSLLQHNTINLYLNNPPNPALVLYCSNIQPAVLGMVGAHLDHEWTFVPCQPWTCQAQCSAPLLTNCPPTPPAAKAWQVNVIFFDSNYLCHGQECIGTAKFLLSWLFQLLLMLCNNC